jgi:hypothetical protein
MTGYYKSTGNNGKILRKSPCEDNVTSCEGDIE